MWKVKPLTNFSQIILLRTPLNRPILVTDCCLYYILSKDHFNSKVSVILIESSVSRGCSRILTSNSKQEFDCSLWKAIPSYSQCLLEKNNGKQCELQEATTFDGPPLDWSSSRRQRDSRIYANIGKHRQYPLFLCLQTTWVNNLWLPTTKNTWW